MGDIAPPQGRSRSGSIGAWYSGSYGNITRTTRLRATPFTPGGLRNLNTDVTIPLDVGGQGNAGLRGYGRAGTTDAAAGGNATTPGNGTTAAMEAAHNKGSKGKGGKKGETLFGPDLGLDENESEGWLKGQDRKERVPLSVVKDWVENAKKEEQGVHQTTTLQALVNLKRPTLTLVPVSQDEIVPAETNSDSTSYDPGASRASIDRAGAIRHVLRFTYDASAPRVQISVSIHPRFMNHGKSRVIYTCVREGGFGKVWELPHENALDIGQAMEDEKRAEEELLSASKKLDGDGSEGSDAEDDIKKPAHVRRETAQPNVPDLSSMSAQAMIDNQPRSRSLFDRMRRQRRAGDIEQGIIADIRRQQGGTGEMVEMGPLGGDAAAAAAAQNGEGAGAETAFKEEEGLRVIIRLDALKEDDSPMGVTNAQATHVLLAGTVVGGAATASRPAVDVNGGLAEVPEEGPEATEEGDHAAGLSKRIWFIKVVRREAIIGHHAFLLKEIYGLASSSHNDAPVASGIGDNNPAGEDPMASTPNECIVCLTNPRDVVLLPCRHLVVCRECAVGMIEFGAGGKVARREDANDTTGAGETGADGVGDAAVTAGANTAAAGSTTTSAPTTTTTGRERRKKKGKGWFCPVCRQPYTSLLRLALPANEMTTVEIDAVTSAALSRQPSIGAASIRSMRHSLHRSSSRATLPERGERMLEDIARDNDYGDAEDDLDDDQPERRFEADREDGRDGSRVPPQFVLGDEIDAAAQSAHRDGRAASPPAVELARTSLEGRRSLEGRGWKEAA